MKKLFIAIAFLLMTGITYTGHAQSPATKTHLKKDGTADRRYKDNKATKTAAGPVKKDGTPDMRYKANNTAAGRKKAPKK